MLPLKNRSAELEFGAKVFCVSSQRIMCSLYRIIDDMMVVVTNRGKLVKNNNIHQIAAIL